jgi:uncharacterized protein YutE (UPF0331/DUF86 family)
VVDRALLAVRIASVRDATARIRSTLSPSADAFLADRTAREVVLLDLFLAIQTCVDLGAHWLADEGWVVPGSYADIFRALADHEIIERRLSLRLSSASGFRNLVAPPVWGPRLPSRVCDGLKWPRGGVLCRPRRPSAVTGREADQPRRTEKMKAGSSAGSSRTR